MVGLCLDCLGRLAKVLGLVEEKGRVVVVGMEDLLRLRCREDRRDGMDGVAAYILRLLLLLLSVF